MFRHYLLMAVRNIAQHRLYSSINIAGLAIALSSAILILLYVRDQVSYDRWIPGTANVYRLEVTGHLPGRPALPTARCPFPLLSLAQERVPQIKAATHLVLEGLTVHIGHRDFHENVTVVDPDFLRIIRLPLAEGDPDRALAEPESIVLSQSVARKYFGNADPLGKTLTVTPDRNGNCRADDKACLVAAYPLRISGVLRDLPHNTQLLATLVMPNTSRADGMPREEKEHAWMDIEGYGYVELLPGAEPATVLNELKRVLDGAFDPRQYGINLPASRIAELHLTPFRAVHLTTDRYGGMTEAGSWTTVYGLMAVASLIVLIGCFNFMNLATARATLRGREIALRKLGGATRRQLIVQFLGEAVLTALLSLLIALSLVELLLPTLGRVLGQPIPLHHRGDWRLFVNGIAGAAFLGIVSGTYPALILSAFRPAAALKANAPFQGGSWVPRSVLVVAQFAVSIGLAAGALVMFSQLEFARTLDLGFDREGVVVIGGVEKLTMSAREALARTLLSDPQIAGVAYSSEVPFGAFDTGDIRIRMPGERTPLRAVYINSSPEFPLVYHMRLLAGRLLSLDRGQDVSAASRSRNVLINAEAVRRLGLQPQEAVGTRIETPDTRGDARIVGVLADAKFAGVNDLTQPTVYTYDPTDPHQMTLLSVRLRGGPTPEALAYIDKTWRSFAPGEVIARWFLADAFDGMLRSAEKQSVLIGVSVAVAIFIACLGLFGLAVFTSERRTKEIGIRKVSGARTHDIVRLMLWRISVPVIAANLVAWPVAYHYLRSWLEGYAYRITLSPLYFLAGGTVALAIAWATVFAHTLRQARANPVHALRYE